MLLAIDVGNTNTVFALYKGHELLQSWRCETIAGRSSDEYAVFLKELFALENIDFSQISNVIVASVVPSINFHIERFSQKYLNQTPVFVNFKNVPLKINIQKPQEAGADRLVNAVAVLAYYKTPAIVIDFGTATTFDVIDNTGAYIGGVIAPGIKLSLSALEKAAAQLPNISIQKPNKVIGIETINAMQSGIYYGYKGMIEGIVKEIIKEMGAQPVVIATGGLAPLFAQDSAVIEYLDESLTLKGLLKVHEACKTQAS